MIFLLLSSRMRVSSPSTPCSSAVLSPTAALQQEVSPLQSVLCFWSHWSCVSPNWNVPHSTLSTARAYLGLKITKNQLHCHRQRGTFLSFKKLHFSLGIFHLWYFNIAVEPECTRKNSPELFATWRFFTNPTPFKDRAAPVCYHIFSEETDSPLLQVLEARNKVLGNNKGTESLNKTKQKWTESVNFCMWSFS